jgi:hypothetical protein
MSSYLLETSYESLSLLKFLCFYVLHTNSQLNFFSCVLNSYKIIAIDMKLQSYAFTILTLWNFCAPKDDLKCLRSHW